MTMLRKIPVVFDPEQHTYTLGGKRLHGITSTLLRRVNPDKYAGIPQHIMEQAAERGKSIHEELEKVDALAAIGYQPENEEGRNYVRLKERYGLRPVANEYTVSDMEYYASNIDVVYDAGDGQVDLADFKTTSKFDRDSVAWQLSIYAHLLELNNPGVKVRKLFGIWLRGDIAELIAVERHGTSEVKALMEADRKDEPFDWSPAFPDYITDNEERLAALSAKIKELTAEYEAVKEEVLAQMEAHGDKSFDTGRVLITRVAAQERETFDSRKFREEHGALYGRYLRTTQTKETLKITLR